MNEVKRNRIGGGTIGIAVIDSGIRDEGILTGKIARKIEFLSGDEHRSDVRPGQLTCVHGTTCAEIISGICPEAHFFDLRAMQPDGTTRISRLLEALDWCAHHGVRLIHLSLGTINYFDIEPLEKRVRSLLEQDVSIVAAYHNRNIRTYPAVFPGVFGVRQDREGILDENQFLFQNQPGYGRENSIVAHWWGKDGNERSNSYAAPVITGYVARALLENGEADFHAVSEFLEKNAVLGRSYEDTIESFIHKNVNPNDEGVNIPVIGCAGLGYPAIRMLTNKFENEGFQTLLLQENGTDKDAIPMNYYGGTDHSLGQILHTVDIIYKPDIVFLDFLCGKAYSVAEKLEIDMFISLDCDAYTIKAEGLQRTASESGEISNIICRYF